MPEALYNKIAAFYDDVLGSTESSIEFVNSLIKKYSPGAASILELGCGTGIYLNSLKKDYEVTGIDISDEMLRIAQRKIPEGKFYKKEIETFDLKRKFDIVLCLYDTINHITLFRQWKKIFTGVYKHLNENGIFIFDMNTPAKLRHMTEVSPVLHRFGSNFLIIDVKKKSNYIYNWNLKVFENISGNDYKLVETDIPEASFETEEVYFELSKHFKILKTIDSEKNRVNKYSGRIFFVCKKQNEDK